MSKDSENIAGEEEHRNFLIKLLTNRPLFVIHAFFYASVNGFLILIWLLSLRFTGLTHFWPFHSFFGWGFGLGFHAITYYMYNDLSEYLSILRRHSKFLTVYIYHAFFYISVNLYLFLLNLIDLTFLWFAWTLGIWGIAFGYHTIGFFTFRNFAKKEMQKIREFRPNFSLKKMQTKVTRKIGNFWLLLCHTTYFLVIIILMIIFSYALLGEIATTLIIEFLLEWGLWLGWHYFAFIIFYFIKVFRPVIKGLLIHASFIVILVVQFILESILVTGMPIWLLYFIPLVFIGVIIHAIIAYKWDSIIERAQKVVSEKMVEEIDKETLRGIARKILFWKWSLFVHVINYIACIIIIAIYMSLFRLDPSIILHTAFGWGIGVAFHASIYIVVVKPIKGFWATTAFMHSVVFIVVNVYLVIINVIYTPRILWFPYPLIGWGIGLGIHILIARTVRREEKKEREIKKTKGVLFWQWSLMIHLFIYLMVLGIISISIISNRENFSALFHTAMGWGIGLAIHGAIFYVVLKPIEGFWDYTAFIHLITYIAVGVYLVLLNIIYSPTVIWSPIAIGGWGIGIGFHILLAYLTKNKTTN